MGNLFIIRKGGYYYRPNAQGYTASLNEAGRYQEAEAVAHMMASDAGEISIFPAPTLPGSIAAPSDIKETAERIALEHIASHCADMDRLVAAIADALEFERAQASASGQDLLEALKAIDADICMISASSENMRRVRDAIAKASPSTPDMEEVSHG